MRIPDFLVPVIFLLIRLSLFQTFVEGPQAPKNMEAKFRAKYTLRARNDTFLQTKKNEDENMHDFHKTYLLDSI